MSQLPLSTVLRFWVPLAGTWLMMAVEGPLLTALIARLAEPKPNLAAFGVAFAVAIIIESPVIMFMSASTALVRGRDSLASLWRFAWTVNLVITVAMVVILLPPVFEGLSSLLRLPPEVARLTHGALWILLPWPAAIGDRRFHQGLLIAAGHTRRVAWGTVVRLGAMGTTAFVAFGAGGLEGARLGALALSIGVVAEALASRWMVRHEKRRLQTIPDPERALGWRATLDFYTPLALTSVLAMAVQPMVTFFMGQGRAALESLAVLPVINGLTFLFRSFGLSYQEAAIALMGDRGEHLRVLTRFAAGLAVATAGALTLLTWTPLAPIWFERVAGLTPELARFALDPARVISLVPALSVTLAFQRALLVQARHTRPVGWATAVEVLAIGGVLLWTVVGLDWIGAMGAMVAILGGRILGNLVLTPPCLSVVRTWRRSDPDGTPAASPV